MLGVCGEKEDFGMGLESMAIFEEEDGEEEDGEDV